MTTVSMVGGVSKRLRASAASLDKLIAKCRERGERGGNTRKRRDEATAAWGALRQHQIGQLYLRKLADLRDNGSIALALIPLTTPSLAIYAIGWDDWPHLDYSQHIDMRTKLLAAGFTPESWRRTASAANHLYQQCREEVAAGGKTDPVKEAELAIGGTPYLGFYPTPGWLADAMVDYLRLAPGDFVLEPSAGVGDLAEAVRRAHPLVSVHCIEHIEALANVCQLRGFGVEVADFPTWSVQTVNATEAYRGIVMNPPWERRAPMKHIVFAWKYQLAVGGTLVTLAPRGLLSDLTTDGKDFLQWTDGKLVHRMSHDKVAFDRLGAGTVLPVDLLVFEKH